MRKCTQSRNFFDTSLLCTIPYRIYLPFSTQSQQTNKEELSFNKELNKNVFYQNVKLMLTQHSFTIFGCKIIVKKKLL